MALFRRRELVDVPATLDDVVLGRLDVHTAESLVIVTLGVADVPLLLDALPSPTRLSAGETRVNLVPVRRGQPAPAFDPNRGWIIPVTSAVAESIRETVLPEPGGYEITGCNVAFLVE